MACDFPCPDFSSGNNNDSKKHIFFSTFHISELGWCIYHWTSYIWWNMEVKDPYSSRSVCINALRSFDDWVSSFWTTWYILVLSLEEYHGKLHKSVGILA